MSALPRLACLVMALAALPCAAAEIPLDQRRSAYDDMSRDNKAMQDDDTSNPAMLSVLDGEALWNAKAGESGKSCADCHGDAKTSMKGVAARYPAFDAASGRPVDLEQRINISREKDQQAKPFASESKDMLAISAYVAMQSRGEPIGAYDDARLKPFIEKGRDRVQSARRAAQPVLRAMPRRQLGQASRRQRRAAGPPDRLSGLPAGMAEPRLVAAALAQLHDRHARGELSLRRAGVC